MRMRNLRIATVVGLLSFLVGGAATAVAAVIVVSPIALLLLPQRDLPNAYPATRSRP